MNRFKRFMMGQLARMMISCEKSTFLSSKKIDRGLTFRETISLKIHQATCQICKQYEEEIEAIDQYAKKNSSGFIGNPPYTLSKSTKKRIQQELVRELDD